MTTIASSRVDKFLTGLANQPQRRGNLVFALDATASREQTWDTACQLQAQMFQEVATIGTLNMQLVYYRGAQNFGGECKASRWVDDPMSLAKLMTGIRCDAGYTQIARVLSHVSRETLQRKINALVFVGDACEENGDQLIGPTMELAGLGVPAFMFQEGSDPTAASRFQEIARLTHGAYLRFNQGAAQQLSDILRAVAAFAVGGATALERQSSAAAKLLLQQVKSKMAKRLATNAVPRLDVWMLSRKGHLVNGAISKWVWPLPALTLTVTARAMGHCLLCAINDGVETPVMIVGIAATLGNTCPYFACNECERPVRYLYIHNDRLGCRQCQDLAFASRQPGQWNTTARQISRLRAQLAMLEARALAESSRRRQPARRIQKATHG